MTQQGLIKSVKIRLFQWGDDYVVYGQFSGDTHLLDGVSGELICALSKKAMPMAELLKKLNELFEDATEAELEDYLTDFIAKFQKLGLLDIE